MPSPPLAVSMQTNSTPALTPALSPGRGRPFSPCWSRSPRGDLPKHRDCFSLSLGERAGVRASLRSNYIVTALLSTPEPSTIWRRSSSSAIQHCCGLKVRAPLFGGFSWLGLATFLHQFVGLVEK